MNQQKIAFRMFLNPGRRDEYKRRHDAIWPELVDALKTAGISDYSIYLDEERDVLFSVMRLADDHSMDQLPQHPVMGRWWAHMADIMKSHADGSPVMEALPCMFHMP